MMQLTDVYDKELNILSLRSSTKLYYCSLLTICEFMCEWRSWLMTTEEAETQITCYEWLRNQDTNDAARGYDYHRISYVKIVIRDSIRQEEKSISVATLWNVYRRSRPLAGSVVRCWWSKLTEALTQSRYVYLLLDSSNFVSDTVCFLICLTLCFVSVMFCLS